MVLSLVDENDLAGAGDRPIGRLGVFGHRVYPR